MDKFHSIMSLLEKFKTIRYRTNQLCEPLKIEDYIPQPVNYISPPKWHLAHTTWFFEEFVLSKYVNGYKRFHPDFAYLFNSYYNNVGERTLRANRGNMTRPTVEETYQYRNHVDDAMTSLLGTNISKETKDVIGIGLNHEQQHQELLITDLKFTLGHNPLFPIYKNDGQLVGDINLENGWTSISEGVYDIGYSGNAFCYDNELGEHKVFLHDFEISKSLVTNGEFINFIEDGSYENFDIWLDEGWTWVKQENIKAPLYWHKINGSWHHFTLGGLKRVNPEEILCHISYYEAAAYAEWKRLRLPTEFEWEVASKQLEWGKRWEWTNSAYLPYPNFSKAEGALGEYNGKFMINQMVLRGASVATSDDHSRNTYRNFFHPQFQWQFTGIRLAK